jgi:hypothetical protein
MSDKETIISIVMKQTNYDYEQTLEKLQQHNDNYLHVIKEYMGIPIQKVKPIKSVNQEIYKQIRSKLDTSMKEYNNKNPMNLEHVVQNLQEEESNLHK